MSLNEDPYYKTFILKQFVFYAENLDILSLFLTMPFQLYIITSILLEKIGEFTIV
jgi:hypothetical protein